MQIYHLMNKRLYFNKHQPILVKHLNIGKIIASTNLVESSVIIDNIVFVVDCCFVK